MLQHPLHRYTVEKLGVAGARHDSRTPERWPGSAIAIICSPTPATTPLKALLRRIRVPQQLKTRRARPFRPPSLKSFDGEPITLGQQARRTVTRLRRSSNWGSRQHVKDQAFDQIAGGFLPIGIVAVLDNDKGSGNPAGVVDRVVAVWINGVERVVSRRESLLSEPSTSPKGSRMWTSCPTHRMGVGRAGAARGATRPGVSPLGSTMIAGAGPDSMRLWNDNTDAFAAAGTADEADMAVVDIAESGVERPSETPRRSTTRPEYHVSR